MILQKLRKLWLAFYPRPQKIYRTVGLKVVPFSRSGGGLGQKVIEKFMNVQTMFMKILVAWGKYLQNFMMISFKQCVMAISPFYGGCVFFLFLLIFK